MIRLISTSVNPDLLRYSLRPDRLGTELTERLFFTTWLQQSQLDTSDIFLTNLFLDWYPHGLRLPVTERDKVVATAVVQWLGTMAGCIFHSSAQAAYKTMGLTLQEAYVTIWRQRNDPKSFSRINALKSLLDQRTMHEQIRGWPGNLPPTKREHHVAEAIMWWLGSDEGRAFMTKVETAITTDCIRYHLDNQYGLNKNWILRQAA
jgi:hypothetical protein